MEAKKFSFEHEGLLQNHELYAVRSLNSSSLSLSPQMMELGAHVLCTPYLLRTSVYPREAEILRELRDASSTHPKASMGTKPDAGRFMSLLLKLVDAKKTIEIGVFTGYSLLLTALALPDDGKVVGIDMDRKAYDEIGSPIIKKAGVEHKIQFIQSNALPALDNLLEDASNEGSFDFAFVDADKANYKNYHERLLKLIKVGGLILYDNTLWGGTVIHSDEQDVLSEYMRPGWKHTLDFNRAMASDPRGDISQIPLGDGVTLCRRLY